MSVFSKQTWGGSCASANQSPINLSQSSAKPCNLSCSFSFDDTTSAGGMVMISDEGLVMSGGPQLGSCKFRDQTYFCDAIVVNHPSHHTLEGVQADGEVIALCRTPTGDRLMVSSLFHVNPNDTASSSFFKQFVPYATSSFTKVSLNSWSLNQMGSGGYYVYSGSTVIPPCTPCEWVVFKTMINMDPTDFAFLVRNAQAGSRNIQSLGNRDIFYNNQEAGGALPHDNKTYLVMRPLKGNKTKFDPVKKVDLRTDESKQNALNAEKKNSTTEKVKKHISDHPWEYFSIFLTILATLAGIYFGYNNYITADGHAAFSVLEWSKDLAKRWRLPASSP